MTLEEHEHKFYSQDPDGCFTLNFPNRHALSNQEIENRFAPFGQVLSLRCAGDERGFRFVRLSSEEEAVAAIIGFRNDPFIQLKERRINKNRNGGYENRNGSSENRSYNKTQNGKNGWHPRRNDNQQNGDMDRRSDRDDDDRMSISSRLTQIRTPSVKDAEEPPMTLEKVNNVRSMISETFVDRAESKKGDDCFEGQSDMPPLVIAKSPLVVIAQEVIVANIHDNYGCAFILHLLEKCHPIAITEMNYVKHRKPIKYCHVYFRTEVEADIAIQGYDNYNLLGRKLIIFKPV